MNLRSRTSAISRTNKDKGRELLLTAIIYFGIVAVSFFGVFSYTLYLNGLTESINKQIAKEEQQLYRIEREIQNTQIKLENYSRKTYITSKIQSYELRLHTPNQYQVINLNEEKEHLNKNEINREFAYNGN